MIATGRVMILCALAISGNAYILSSSLPTPPKWANNEEIEIFRHYLRIPTVQPKPDYKPAVAFLEKQAANLSLPISVYHPVDNENPVVVITWKGSEPDLPSVILNSHMDVVPVFEEYWTHPPFAAEMEENGDIFARGSQDTKNIGTQYLAAIRALKRQGINQLKRTIHVVFVPDEEVGGRKGMAGFSVSDVFKAMNVAFVLDEGNVEDNGIVPAYYVERTPWQLEFTFHGQSGHGSKLFDNTPGEKLNYVLEKLYEFRKEEKRKFQESKYPLGNVTTVNLVILNGGVADNVIPAELKATFDIGVSANAKVNEFQQQVDRWCEEAGGNITIINRSTGIIQKPTRVDDSNPYWVAFKRGAVEAGIKVKPAIVAGSTDMKYIRNLDISDIGFSPLLNTVPKLHDHNEYLNADVYLAGIEIYKKIIMSLGNTPI